MKERLYIGIWAVALLAIAVVLLSYEHHLLWKLQELNLFLFTPLYFEQQMVVSGGLLVWLGTFFTQFLYQPWLGVLFLCAWWWLLMWLIKRAFCISNHWATLMLVPVVLLLIANVDMGYWIYTQKLRGWFFIASIGTTAVAALLWTYRCLSSKRGLRQVFLVLTALAGYPLLGAYALAAVLLMGIWTWRLEKQRSMAAATSFLSLFCLIVIPLLCYRYVYCQTSMANIWWTALPVFHIFESYRLYYIPYGLLGVFFLMLTVTWQMSWPVRLQKPTFAWFLQSALGLLLVICVSLFWYKDENYHHELAMQDYVDHVRWENVLQEADRQVDEPTRAIVMMRNLALFRLGLQGDDMYRFRGGSKRPNSPFPIQSSLLVGSMIYYHYGMLNDCHHLCIESGVEYGWRIEHLKFMARCTMFKKELRAMYKFTSMLKHTLYYERWAMMIEDLQRHPDRLSEALETGPITHMLHHEDMMGADNGYTEQYLMGVLADESSDDPYFQEACLLATLWTKDSNQFWPAFIRYVKQHRGAHIPRHYQEACLLFGHQSKPEALSLPFDPMVTDTYQKFMDELPKYRGRPLEEVQTILYPAFGNTFYYDFYLMNKLTYY